MLQITHHLVDLHILFISSPWQPSTLYHTQYSTSHPSIKSIFLAYIFPILLHFSTVALSIFPNRFSCHLFFSSPLGTLAAADFSYQLHPCVITINHTYGLLSFFPTLRYGPDSLTVVCQNQGHVFLAIPLD